MAVFGLILFWQLCGKMTGKPKDWLKAPVLQWLIASVMGIWLLFQSDSKTSIICLGVGCLLLLATKIPLFGSEQK